MQIGAGNVDEGTVKQRFTGVVEHQFVERFAAFPVAAKERVRANARCGERLLKIETSQDLGDVGAENDSGADAREVGCLFIYRDGESCALQQSGDGETGKAPPPKNGEALLCVPFPPPPTSRGPR